MKIEWPHQSSILQKDIPVGTTFTSSNEPGALLLKAYSLVVNLTDPLQTWHGFNNTTRWDNYRLVECTITVK